MAILLRPNPEAFNFLDAAGIARTEANAPIFIGICQLTTDLKNYGLWDKMKAIYPFVGQAGVSSSFEVNLKEPNRFRGIFNGGWTFASTGVQGNGTSAFFDTNLNQSSNITNTSQHISFYSRTDYTSGSPGEIGIATSNTFLLLRSVFYSNQCDANFVATSQNLKGFYLGSRTSSALRRGFYNGSQVHQVEDTPNATSSLNYYIGALNNNGTAGFFSPKECAFATIGDGLTNTEAANLYTAVQRFQTTLGRQV